ncbi:MAG TPA: PAS domain S-box protein, partial [Ignavibacteriaceae bacterium]|nr:PAS domain S-box protein [Ignavibacteriaceae bacterium]
MVNIITKYTSHDFLPQNDLIPDKNGIDYKAVFKYSIDAFIVISADFSKIIELNEAALDLLEYNRSEALKLKGRDLLFKYEYRRLRQLYIKNQTNFIAFTMDIELKSKSLKKIPVSVSIRKLPDQKGNFLLIARDITNVKQTEEALKKEAFIFENLNDAVIITDLEGYIQSWNKAAESVFGYTRNEVVDKFIDLVFKHDGIKNSFENIKREIAQNSFWAGEISINLKNKKLGTSEVSVFPFRDSSREHIAYVIIAKDITQRKRIEQEKRERDLMYKALIESSADAIYVLKGKRLLLVNSAWCKMFGYTEMEATSEDFDIMSIIAPESKKMILKRFSSYKEYSGGYSNYEMKGITKNNRLIDLDVKVNKILWNGEEVFQGIYRDITDRKKAEIELKESEEKFRKLAEKSLVGIYIIQMGVFKYVNPKLAEIFGYTTDEIIDKKGTDDLTYPEDRDIVSKNVTARLSGNIDSIEYAFRGIKKDGSLIYVVVYGSATKIGGIPAVVGTLLDVSEHKKAEEALRISEIKYKTIIEAASDAIIIVDIESRKIVDVNKKAEILTRRSRNELIGQSHLILHPVEYANEYSNSFGEVIERKQQISSGDIFIVDKDGNKIPVEISNSNYVLGGREVIQGIFRDMRERRRIEEEIRKLSRAVEQSSSAIVITDISGNIEYVNPYFYKMTGYSPNELLGKNPRILKSGETSAEEYSNLWRTISSGNVWHGEFHNKKKNGDLYWEQASISSIRDEKGKITHYIAISEDITNMKRMQKELLLAKERAEESDKMKSEFLSQMSHEIRTPLNVILSYNSFLQDELSGLVNEDVRLSFNSINSAGKRLLRTIDMILNLAAIQKGRIDFNFEPVDLSNIIESLASEFEFHAREKNLELKVNIPGKKIIIPGDEYLISEIFQNLLDNA